MNKQIQSGQTILFVGDSITDCDRRDPVHAPLGRGFVRQLRDLFVVRHPDLALHFINRGIGGNTVDDLRSRWQDDVLAHRPDHLVVQVGMNDLNQFLCRPDRAFLAPDGYAEIYDSLLVRTRAAFPELPILLMSSFLISTDTAEGSYRARLLQHLPSYINAVRAIATAHGADHLDLHALFQGRLVHDHPDRYCDEPIHPNITGHALIADAVFNHFTRVGQG